MAADIDRELRAFVDFARVHLPEKLTPWEPDAADFLACG
jgi:hypothetical protein